MTAREIVDLLAAKHSEDVFIPECKDGPSAGCSHRRLDAWAMKKSWSQPTTFGYEVKVSRSDFKQDDKWRDYLGLCSKFYFVCPWALIDPSELPAEAGLLWVAKTGGRLWEKKKAPLRAIDGRDIEGLFRYVLMNRVKITREYEGGTDINFWSEFAAKRSEDRELGRCNSKRVAQTLKERVYRVEAENRRLVEENEKFDDVRKTLKDLGIEESWRPAERIRQQYARLKSEFPDDAQWAIKHAAESLTKIVVLLKRGET